MLVLKGFVYDEWRRKSSKRTLLGIGAVLHGGLGNQSNFVAFSGDFSHYLLILLKIILVLPVLLYRNLAFHRC